ncbi:ABC transporter substrate-binding protein [Inquilinus limosus]|uniref:ABC transporter substrate-binding protein n=1 Tax=Inquilinus limosus TaxID=171674 RepID=UPI00040642D6|nr:ABC transporter substrate-binding protein [Inquilinus limosus]
MKRILAGLALALATAGAAHAETVLRIGDQKGDARAVLEAAGELSNLPYRIEWSEFPAAAPLLEALNADAIDAGSVGDAPFTFAAAAGVPVKAIAAIRSKQDGLTIVVPGDSPVRGLQGLVGKNIGTGRGSIGHQLILAALEQAGLQPDAVNIVFLLPAEAKAALSSGAIDGWSTWEPYTSQLELQEGARRVVTGVGITPGLGFFVARPDAIEARRAALQDFVGRLARARAWGTTNYPAYAASWSKLVGLPEQVALQYFARRDVRPVAIDDAVVADEQRTIDLYLRAGLIRAELDANDILDRSFNDPVLAELNRK